MADWAEVEASFPDARRWRDDLSKVPVAHLGTVDAAGRPRIHPFCPHFTRSRMYAVVTAASPKRLDLAQRGAFAVHSLNVDEPGPDFDEFELALTGTARRVDDAATWTAVRAVCPYPVPDGDRLFELSIESALRTVWDPFGTPGRRPHRLVWREGWEAPRPPSNEQD